MALRFALYFKDLENVHLFKDVGMVPFMLGHSHGFESRILCSSTENHAPYTTNELAGMTITPISGGICSYLRKHAREIDVLMLFHVKTETMYAGLIYKRLNPSGVLYVKYDLDDKKLLYATWGHRNFFTQAKRNLLFALFRRKLDLISIENRSVYEELAYLPKDIRLHLPNGFWQGLLEKTGVRVPTFAEKENLAILVGRHGSRQKNSEFLFDVLGRSGVPDDWRVCFIGPTTPEFDKRLAEFYGQCPHLRERVVSVGAVTGKRELFDYYRRSKIFCLPSLWEGFPLVGPEALCFGNVLLMNRELACSDDLTANGTAGYRLAQGDVEGWASCLRGLMSDQSAVAEKSTQARQLFEENFDWEKLTGRLAERLNRLARS